LNDSNAITDFERRFTRRFLDMLLLKLLSDRPRWGYELMSEINRKFSMKIGPGKTYPMMKSLEAGGFVRSKLAHEGRRKRKVYHVTREGRELLEAFRRFLYAQASS